MALATASAWAGGPRFVTGPPFFTGPAGVPIGWKQANLLYYTDPGALSAAVNHQAADALVAAAAGVWNVPVASITVGQGGALAEHVSGQNVYLDTSGMVFPADAMSSNAAAVPIAVVYDTDGSVTDLLLGSGASSPSSCRQNAVTQTVDGFDPAGYILHAVVVLNGRCTGTAPELQLEMQYQLMRAFGRVLGLAWSQTNDNVFTGSPVPTHNQAMNWPIMHPIDIICGLYAYQCLPSPFQLRPDDISSMVTVYPIGQNATPAAGKQQSLSAATNALGHVLFPTGEGMAGVNVLVTRQAAFNSSPDGWYEASGVSGAGFRTGARSPFMAADASAWGSFGTTDPNQMGAYAIAYVPIDSGVPWQNMTVSTEPVNPLYMGAYGLAPYAMGAVAPSGSAVSGEQYRNGPYGGDYIDFTVASAASSCGSGQDGTAAAPMAVPATGWWQGLLCGYGHASYAGMTVRPGRSFTIEVTALDAQGIPTEAKAMPAIGVFAPTDGASSLPSLGVAAAAFNSVDVGMTSIQAQTGQLTSFWLGIADERGDGRPDYAYQARLFYADNIVPAQMGTAGGRVTIAGMGFRAGNAVTINGVAAKVVSWTANAIVLTAPTMAAAYGSNSVAVDVTVSDLSTGASSTMTGAFTYTTAAAPNTMRLVNAQAGTVYVGDVATTPFAVQVVGPDGVTPVVGDAVVFSNLTPTTGAGSVQFAACGAATCTVKTDAKGMASTGVTPETAGTVTMQAMDGTLVQTASFAVLAQTGSLNFLSAPSGNLPVGLVAQTQINVADLLPNGFGNAGRAITFTVPVGSATFSGCASAVCVVTTNWAGQASISVTPTAVGPVTIKVADGDVTATTSFVVVSNTDVMTVATSPAATSYVGNYAGTFAVNLFEADGVTRDVWQNVTFTGPAGVVFDPCGSNVCTVATGWGGLAGVQVHTALTGTFAIQAAFGSVTQSVIFSMVPHTIGLKVISVPLGAVPVGSVTTPFAVQLLQDGTTPLAGVSIAMAGQFGAVGLTACLLDRPGCDMNTDDNGIASSTLTPLLPGLITLTAVYAPYTATASFIAAGVGETMTIVQQPLATVYVGDTVNFAVQVMGPGGVTPIQGDPVLYVIASGPFGWSDWTTVSVPRATDGNGESYEVGVASAAGPITVTASDGVSSQTFTFTAIARPDVVQVVSAPASGGYAGAAASTPFAVQVLMNDGVTPLPNRTVTVSVTNGAGSLAACGGAASCQIVTDAQGMVSTVVTPLSAGTITLTASEGGVQQSVSFTTIAPVAPPQLSVTALNQATYIAAGATITLPLNAVVLYDANPAASQAVVWAMSGGFGSATTNTVTNSNGVAAETMLLGPMAAGGKAIATACAWGNVCAEFDGFGVDPASEAIVLVSGAGQAVTAGAALAPVVVKVVDGAGHPVAAAAVSVYQTVTAYAGPCPASGRCPAAVVLASQATVGVSGIDGTLTIVPLVVSGQSTQTEIAFSVGTQGFATTLETSGP